MFNNLVNQQLSILMAYKMSCKALKTFSYNLYLSYEGWPVRVFTQLVLTMFLSVDYDQCFILFF